MEPVLSAQWFTDPFCAWSFAAEKSIEEFRTHFGSSLRFEHRLFVLYRDINAFLKNHHLDRPRDFAPKILQVSTATGVSMTPKAWESENVPSSTFEPCRFVKAVLSINTVKGDRFLTRLRELAFLEGENIADHALLFRTAEAIGIQKKMLDAALRDPSLTKEIDKDNDIARSEGVTHRPTLIVTNSGGDRVFIGGLRNPDLFILAGESLIQES